MSNENKSGVESSVETGQILKIGFNLINNLDFKS